MQFNTLSGMHARDAQRDSMAQKQQEVEERAEALADEARQLGDHAFFSSVGNFFGDDGGANDSQRAASLPPDWILSWPKTGA
jgi:hypothetical protein